MTNPDDKNTLRLAVQPMDPGYPAIVDTAFTSAVTKTKVGGPGTQGYFDSLNQTADFWMLFATEKITLAPAVDAQGRQVMITSSGNVGLRVQAVPQKNSAKPNQVGVLTVTTRETSGTGVSHRMTAGIVVENNPSTLVIDDKVFNQLLPALYVSTNTALKALAVAFAVDSRVESPDVDAESLASTALFAASGKAIGLVAALVEFGLEFTAVTWGQMIGEGLGVGALMAIPAIIEFLGHTMTHSVVIDNLSPSAVTWTLATVYGESTVTQPVVPIPGQRTLADPLHPSTELKLSSQLHLLHMNWTRETYIGYVLSLTPDGGKTVQVMVNIPIVGDNVIWVGPSTASPNRVWMDHHNGPQLLSTSTTIDGLTVTVSLNKLSGTVDDAYFYCSSIVIAPN